MSARRLLVCFCAWFASGAIASAQDIDAHWTPSSPESIEPSAPPVASGPWALRAELGLTTRDEGRTSLWVVSPVFAGAYRVSERWAIGVDWGIALAIDTPAQGSSEQRVGSGNPLLSVAHTLIDRTRSQLDVWAGVTAPLAWLADGTQRGFSRAMFAHALASRGLWNPWLWAPEQIGAASGGRWLVDPSKDVRVRLEGALGATIPLTDVTQDAADLYLQLASSFELHAGLLSLGMRLQAVLMTADTDPLQLALAPYARVEAGQWAFDARVLINLDEPLGVAGAGLDAWGVLLAVEVTP